MKINRNQLKYILIIAMLIDHITWAFIPTRSVAGQCLHFIGRLTGPGMALLLAEGYQYTRNKAKYALRLFVFAMISWAPYCLNDYGKWPYFGMGMFGV
ncbi:MAG: conjugal transfer protein TraX, partial [Lachnospiraceae bacterium]|nr:conjugal transfer protein TraX [Lachnospiraceae bacterium]